MVGHDKGGAGFGHFGEKFFGSVDLDLQKLVPCLIGIAMPDGNAGRHFAEAGDSDDFVELGGDATTTRGAAREKRILFFEREREDRGSLDQGGGTRRECEGLSRVWKANYPS